MMSEMSPEEEIKDHALQGRWDEVVKMCKDNYALIRTVKINKSNEDTVLHAAVNSGKERIVAELVNVIIRHEESEKEAEEEEDQVIVHEDEKKSALEIRNARGDTSLHLAASRGFAYMCYCITGENNERANLLRVNNEQGETPLFLAALNGHKDTFSFLLSCFHYKVFDLYRYDGDTILHWAIRREYFDLAVIIMHNDKYKDLLIDYVNKKGETPLKVLATRPLAFRSCSNLRWWDELLYHCTRVEQVDVQTATQSPPKPTMKADVPDPNHKVYPENYYETCCHFVWPKIATFFDNKRQQGDTEKTENKSCYNFFSTLPKVAASLIGYFRKKWESAGDAENPVDQELANLPPNYATISECLKSAYLLAARFSGLDLLGIRRIKEKHVWSAQLLDLLMEEPIDAYFGSGASPYQSNQEMPGARSRRNTNDQGQEKVKDKIDRDSTLLVAARNGILEMVNKILHDIPSVIEETTVEYKRNILLAAVEGRQPNVIEALRNHELWDTLIAAVDENENTALHLAAQKSQHSRAWQIAGSVLHMQWDIKWYEYIKCLVPHQFHLRNNEDNKTPPEVFTETHENLLKDGGVWLEDTSEFCSVVAVLIAGVAFATANAVPGGIKEETGKPNFEGQPAFDLFAITSVLALYSSVTALIMFMVIHISQKTARYFRRDLPLKLILSLNSLFLSIASMLVSFCAANFFVAKDRFKGILFPIYAATFLPVTFYAATHFLLSVDILRAIFTEVPQPSDKGSDW